LGWLGCQEEAVAANGVDGEVQWGQPAPQSWFEEGSPFAGVEPRPAAFKAEVLVAN